MLDAGNWFAGLGLLAILVAAEFGGCWVYVIGLSSCHRNMGLDVALPLLSAED